MSEMLLLTRNSAFWREFSIWRRDEWLEVPKNVQISLFAQYISCFLAKFSLSLVVICDFHSLSPSLCSHFLQRGSFLSSWPSSSVGVINMKGGLWLVLLVCVAAEPSTALQAYGGFVSSVQEFWNGVYLGMQTDIQPDVCVTQITAASGLYAAAYDSFVGTFTGVNPALLLNTITSLNQAFNGLVQAVETCQLKVLTYNVQNIFNRVGFGKALINLSVNMNKVIVSATQTYWGYLMIDWGNGLYRNVGYSVGELLSIILAYEF